jgi:DNA-binding CsgD family transcriptional regulator
MKHRNKLQTANLKQTCLMEKPWSISSEMRQFYNKENLKHTLFLFNQINNGNGAFFIINNIEDKFILEEPIKSAIGYSAALLKNGTCLDFFIKVLKPEELNWYLRMRKAYSKFFFGIPKEQRKYLENTHYVIAQSEAGIDIILGHRMVPYQLDLNGNLWLELGYVFVHPAHLPITPKASISNFLTGERYDFAEDKFVLTNTKALSMEEIQILKHLSEGLTVEQICDVLHNSPSTYKRKKKKIYEKLNVTTSSEATYKAHSMGLI